MRHLRMISLLIIWIILHIKTHSVIILQIVLRWEYRLILYLRLLLWLNCYFLFLLSTWQWNVFALVVTFAEIIVNFDFLVVELKDLLR